MKETIDDVEISDIPSWQLLDDVTRSHIIIIKTFMDVRKTIDVAS